jgi:hypothetical protein
VPSTPDRPDRAAAAGVGIDPILILPTLTKYLAGGTAMMGVMDDMRRAGQVSVELLNASAGFLISPFDLPGVAVLISAGRRVAASGNRRQSVPVSASCCAPWAMPCSPEPSIDYPSKK